MTEAPVQALLTIAFIVFIFAFLIAIFAFWIWMLFDCLTRNFDKPNNKPNDKIVWVIVLIFLHFLGGLLYYFIVKRKDLAPT